MSRIYVDELVSKSGLDKVTFIEGVKVSPTETLDLNGASITLDTGVGLNNQLLASTGSGLKWVTFTNTDSTYSFNAQGAAVNDIKLNLVAGGSASGTDQVSLTGAGSVSISELNGVITFTGVDTNTTYDLAATDITNGVSINLSGSDSTVDSVTLKEGSNIAITRAGNEITIETLLSGTVGGPQTSTDGAIVLFDGTNGTLLKDSGFITDVGGNLTTPGSITTASGTASLITFWYDQTGSFPNANAYEGAVAYSDNNNALFFASGNSWYQLARLSDIQPNTDTTYSVSLQDHTTNTKKIVLADSNGLLDGVEFYGHNGIELSRSAERLNIGSRLYSVSTEVGTGNSAKIRLTGENRDISNNLTTSTTDDIVIAGADGIEIERTDVNTLTVRAPAFTVTQYTDDEAKDAAAQAIVNGTHLGITFTYDQQNQTINSQVGTVPTTYNFTVTASGFDDYQVSGTDRAGSVSGNDPAITVYEGDTINLDVSAVYTVHPLYIRDSAGGSSVSTPAAIGEGTASVSWIPNTAGVYYYQCGQHPDMLGTITVLSAGGGGGGGTSILYDLYGTQTTSNHVILNLDPSIGTADQIEFAGAGGTTISWDSLNNKATIQSIAPVNADWNATSGLARILNKPTIPAAYTLPTADASTLGGIKVGANLSIDGNGVLSANPGAYTLPIADATTLGGIKIGSGLEIDAGGVVTVTASGATGLATRQELSGTTTSIADNATANLNISGYKAYTLLKVETDADAWVRIYTDDAARTADALRSEGTDPAIGSGVIAETRGSGVIMVSPGVFGYNNDSPSVTTTIYTSVTNRSGSATPITVTLTAIRLEA
jgi:plastocyanin